MCRTTERSCAIRTSVRPSSLLEVAQQVQDLRLDRDVERRDGLVGDDQLRLQRERARDADALALAAGELVRVAVVVLGVEADLLHQLLHRAPAPLARPPRARGSRTARAMIAPTVLRGLSDEYGSWKIICISRRSGFSARLRRVRDVLAVEADRAARRLEQPHDQARRGASCRSRSRRRCRASRRASRRSETPSTACTAPTWRWKMIPRVIGKCLTRSRTSTSGSLMPAPLELDAVARGLPGQLARPQLRPDLPARPAVEQAGDPMAGLVRQRLELRARRARCRSRTYGQRGWNEQPLGRVIRLGGRPGDRDRAARRAGGRGAGSTAAGPRCRGARARRRSSSVGRLLDDPARVHHGDLVGRARRPRRGRA